MDHIGGKPVNLTVSGMGNLERQVCRVPDHAVIFCKYITNKPEMSYSQMRARFQMDYLVKGSDLPCTILGP